VEELRDKLAAARHRLETLSTSHDRLKKAL
jgi:hypothetical protein